MHNIDRTQLELNPEYENFENEQFEMLGETHEILTEAEQMELAAELLEVRDEQEMNHFLGSVAAQAAGALGRRVLPAVGRAIGQNVIGAVGKILPEAVGGFSGQMGKNLADGLSRRWGITSPAEAARQIVNVTANATNNATSSANANPQVAVNNAMTALQGRRPVGQGMGSGGPVGRGYGQSGRWVRRGNRVTLFGL